MRITPIAWQTHLAIAMIRALLKPHTTGAFVYGPFLRIKTLLIANRSEVAARIQATAQRLGIKTVCVYAQDDSFQAHLAHADAVYQLSGTGHSAYLAQDELLAIAQKSGADAVHPGYGFLAEVGTFAQRIRNAGILFVGPSPHTITSLGDKATARSLAQRCGIPVVPGQTFHTTQVVQAAAYATQIGYPALLKATGGGGGRGIERINDEASFESVWHKVVRQAERLFSCEHIVVEKYIEEPRHIEVQIAGDGTNAIHLHERDCSTQRRRQKIVEEAPAPHLTPLMRAKLHDASLRLAHATGYTSIGTVEFIVTGDDQFYFLEVNTRLQVEHGVTEMVTGIDLVALQLHITEQNKLPLTQEHIIVRGHAIQCRVYAEEPTNNFAPSIGTIDIHETHTPPGARIEHSITTPYPVTGLYDAMLSKLVTHGITRNEARTAMAQVLKTYTLAGVPTNLCLLAHIMQHSLFAAGTVHTQSMPMLLATFPDERPTLCATTAALLSAALTTSAQPAPHLPQPRPSRWKERAWK